MVPDCYQFGVIPMLMPMLMLMPIPMIDARGRECAIEYVGLNALLMRMLMRMLMLMLIRMPSDPPPPPPGP